MTIEDVRAGVLGENVVALPVNPGGRGTKKPRRKRPEQDDDCPVTPLGHRDGTFYFLDARGQQRGIGERLLHQRAGLSGLLLGDTDWLLRRFPKKRTDDDGTETVTGFHTARAAEFLMRRAADAGLFGPHVTLRQPGIWLAAGDEESDAPAGIVVHCGDQVRLPDAKIPAGVWRRAGFRFGDHIWPSAPKTPRPADQACGPEVARGIQQRWQDLWSFRAPGGAIAALGLVGVGYYGAAAPWRSNGFLTGPPGSGKSYLLDAMRALSPPHHYTNNTSAAGLEQELNGRAIPSFLDESTDRVDQEAAQKLMDLVLSASGGQGTQGHRGGANGIGRIVSMVSCIVMAAVAPPDMKPQHRQRFTLIELQKPGAGEDHRAAMEALIADSRLIAAELWARALAGFSRNIEARAVFRTALADAGCDAREMDQLGALLAAWWVLTADGVPDARSGRIGVAAIGSLVTGADATREDDASRRLIQYLSTVLVQRDRSTDQEALGALIGKAFGDGDADAAPVGDMWQEPPSRAAVRLLERYGVRVVRAEDVQDKAGRPVPRGGEGDGIWFAARSASLRRLLAGSAFEGDRWLTELARLPGAAVRTLGGSRNVRIGAQYSGGAVWVARNDWDGE